MKQRRYARAITVDCQHHTEEMEGVGLGLWGRVPLAAVGTACELDSPLEDLGCIVHFDHDRQNP